MKSTFLVQCVRYEENQAGCYLRHCSVFPIDLEISIHIEVLTKKNNNLETV